MMGAPFASSLGLSPVTCGGPNVPRLSFRRLGGSILVRFSPCLPGGNASARERSIDSLPFGARHTAEGRA